jgi:hypothetical protein
VARLPAKGWRSFAPTVLGYCVHRITTGSVVQKEQGMSLRRALLTAVATTFVVFGLAGCSLLPLPGLQAAPNKPAVGECWDATTAQASAWADWKGDSATNCSATHTLYTFAIGEVKGMTKTNWSASGSPTALDASIAAKASATCTPALKKFLPTLTWKQQLVSTYFFVPSESEWKSGARWVRCDVGLFALGTTLAQSNFEPLPSDITVLTSGVKTQPKRYDLCLNSSAPVSQSGPFDDPSAVRADCRESPVWTLSSRGYFTEAKGAPYPSDSASNSRIAAVCAKDATGPNQVWVAYAPTASEWAAGDREIECWVGDGTTGSGQDV